MEIVRSASAREWVGFLGGATAGAGHARLDRVVRAPSISLGLSLRCVSQTGTAGRASSGSRPRATPRGRPGPRSKGTSQR